MRTRKLKQKKNIITINLLLNIPISPTEHFYQIIL